MAIQGNIGGVPSLPLALNLQRQGQGNTGQFNIGNPWTPGNPGASTPDPTSLIMNLMMSLLSFMTQALTGGSTFEPPVPQDNRNIPEGSFHSEIESHGQSSHDGFGFS